MHPNEALVRQLYACLASGDAEGASQCYHPDVLYSDPRFLRLRGEAAAALWRMRLEPETQLEVHLVEATGDAEGATARWSARERFRGRTVATEGRSMFAFRDGRISRHYDHYSLWHWSAAALGLPGAVLGWFGPFRWAVRQRAARALERFSAGRY